jgi:hypothetical protein
MNNGLSRIEEHLVAQNPLPRSNGQIGSFASTLNAKFPHLRLAYSPDPAKVSKDALEGKGLFITIK